LTRQRTGNSNYCMNAHAKCYVYGPVPSRRLGRSLGVDLVPHKVCSFDCVYCQLGRTTRKTTQRAAYLPVEKILADLESRLKERLQIDFVTMSGSGEPTLHSALAEIVQAARNLSPVPVAVLTNGSMLYLPEVRAACAAADVVVPSLDAGDEETFRRINRPCPEITLSKVVDGLVRFREEFSGQIWLEIFFVAGLNDDEQQVRRLAALVERIRPDRVHLNTAVRPPAEGWVKPVDAERLERLRSILPFDAEVIAQFDRTRTTTPATVDESAILSLLQRRPCTVDDMAASFDTSTDSIVPLLEKLLQNGLISRTTSHGKTFYAARPDTTEN